MKLLLFLPEISDIWQDLLRLFENITKQNCKTKTNKKLHPFCFCNNYYNLVECQTDFHNFGAVTPE